jgi:hypothetical protein
MKKIQKKLKNNNHKNVIYIHENDLITKNSL